MAPILDVANMAIIASAQFGKYPENYRENNDIVIVKSSNYMLTCPADRWILLESLNFDLDHFKLMSYPSVCYSLEEILLNIKLPLLSLTLSTSMRLYDRSPTTLDDVIWRIG